MINFCERFCSLGCGHTVAFCKHAEVGGKTNQKSLQQHDNELIDLQKLCTNRNFERMIKDGWEWNVVYSCVDEEFPEFADIAQRALNTRNHINNVVGELEACVTLAQTVQDPGMKDIEDWKKLAVQNLTSLCVPCSTYGAVLLEYIMAYGGGDDCEVIHFIDNVSKQFAASLPMGETFWKTLLETEFADKLCKFPFLRTALMLANLTGTKVEDGTARSVTKTHIGQVAGKAKMAETVEAEKTLEDAWNLTEAVSSRDAALKPLGQMFVRIGLKLCGLEKKAGREGKVYSFMDIKKHFLKDLGALLGKTIEYPKWFCDDDDDDDQDSLLPETDATEPSGAVKTFATIENHFDPIWMCGQSGFKLGSKVIEKGIESSSERPGIFVIFSIGETVALHEACHYGGAPVRANVSVEELLRNWSITKADPPLRMQDPSSTAVPEALNLVLKKNKVFSALLEAHSKNQKHLADLSYFRRPDQVRTKDVQIKASALTLVPFVPLNNIVIDSKVTARIIEVEEFDGHRFSIIPTSKPGHEGDVWDKDAPMANAYFWCDFICIHDNRPGIISRWRMFKQCMLGEISKSIGVSLFDKVP